MANIKSAEKRIRHLRQEAGRNKASVSRLRSAVKKYGRPTRRRSPRASATHSEIDRARAKGVIHRNAAARYKSRLAKKAARVDVTRRKPQAAKRELLFSTLCLFAARSRSEPLEKARHQALRRTGSATRSIASFSRSTYDAALEENW